LIAVLSWAPLATSSKIRDEIRTFFSAFDMAGKVAVVIVIPFAFASLLSTSEIVPESEQIATGLKQNFQKYRKALVLRRFRASSAFDFYELLDGLAGDKANFVAYLDVRQAIIPHPTAHQGVGHVDDDGSLWNREVAGDFS